MQEIASIFTYYPRSPDRAIASGTNFYASSLVSGVDTVDRLAIDRLRLHESISIAGKIQHLIPIGRCVGDRSSIKLLCIY